MMTAIELEELYKSRLRGRFPYDDCFWLAKQAAIKSADLIPELDVYFADIAGFCSSASRLDKRPTEQLKWGKKALKLNFFESHSDLAHIQVFITPDQTPKLYEEMKYTEQARLELLSLLDTLVID
jgi:hypothetical protein